MKRGKSRRKLLISWKRLFLCKPVKWETGNGFSPQNEPHKAKLSFSGVLKHFCGNLPKKIFKDWNWLSQKDAKSHWEKQFLVEFEKMQIMKKDFDLMEMCFLCSNQWNATIIKENGFCPQMSHILLK